MVFDTNEIEPECLFFNLLLLLLFFLFRNTSRSRSKTMKPYLSLPTAEGPRCLRMSPTATTSAVICWEEDALNYDGRWLALETRRRGLGVNTCALSSQERLRCNKLQALDGQRQAATWMQTDICLWLWPIDNRPLVITGKCLSFSSPHATWTLRALWSECCLVS